MAGVVACVVGGLLGLSLLARGSAPEAGVPVSVVATVQTPKNVSGSQLTLNDLLVTQNKERRPVTGFTPLAAAGGLQLWLLIDDGTNEGVGLQLSDLRRFVLGQPATTQIGVGYMRNGSVAVAQALIQDHELAAKSLRLPLGTPGISASPYLALTDLIHKWQAGAAAREVLMVSSGIDPVYGFGPDNPYVSEAIAAAQRAGVVVHTIYYSAAGWLGHSGRGIFWGQLYLAELSDATGGEFYWQGNWNPVSFVPYLDDLNQRLNEQYELTFLAKPEKKPGFENIKLATEIPSVRLVGPARVYVPAL